MEVSGDGREVKMWPGVLTNNEGRLVKMGVGSQRAVSYYLEVVIILALFGKYPLHLQLTGITNDDTDISVEGLIATASRLLKRFSEDARVEGKVLKRAFRGTGEVEAGGVEGERGGLVEVRVDNVKWLH